MTCGRVLEANRTFQGHTLDALCSSIALRYEDVGMVLLLHCFCAVSFMPPPPSVGGSDLNSSNSFFPSELNVSSVPLYLDG